MCKKLISACLVLALVCAFAPVVVGASSPFSDAPWGGQPANPENDDASDEGFGFDDFDVIQPTLPPSPQDNPVQIQELVYRGGIKFGMTIDQVKGLEKNKPASEQWLKSTSTQSTYYLMYENEYTLDISSNIEYHFTGTNGTLIKIGVRLAVPNAITSNVMKRADQYREIDQALIEKYGPADGPSSFNYSGVGGIEEATFWGAKRGRNYSIKHALTQSMNGASHYIAYYYEDQGTDGGV